ncbi:phosphonate C-P lyase system protein PhnG [Terrihabitans soli]|uniref:Phosphonate C-P lyase system protein PhnG n=2 Tax=Terrihabitans soli TaxID=708113 RepID=A0A6S6QP46_9HYPH|nr:phosphonate C-P lyase system protein PhnG [Terrihabitans soli]
MGVYARATTEELDAALERIGRPAGAEDMRPPELGLVMARGRMGGTGAPFNAGEVSVTRAAVRLSSGEVGVAYQLGRDRTKARVAATLDALWQTDKRSEVEAALDPIRARIAEQIQLKERRVAATKVDFFTLVRGED